ncbi:uncharacterized protein DSM5745_03979 [Aspergillus mulundensis]|uniref:Uncharacterized protein n=1 Tax=Aspergillus mulundensis TaxID=1810919 RepID=A0A3D8SBK8_9EURO|nr:hypothetical protein DSM5745_03979 [Aspergillus mulundensis]RDW83653.1 hypothetical protein DSM5745_03979 [Aspergillus mulundensis]
MSEPRNESQPAPVDDERMSVDANNNEDCEADRQGGSVRSPLIENHSTEAKGDAVGKTDVTHEPRAEHTRDVTEKGQTTGLPLSEEEKEEVFTQPSSFTLPKGIPQLARGSQNQRRLTEDKLLPRWLELPHCGAYCNSKT